MADNLDDIKSQVDKIKEQMALGVDDPDNSMFRMDDNSGDLLPPELMDEPMPAQTLEAQGDLLTQENQAPQEVQEELQISEEENNEDWDDPFGDVFENDAVKKYVIYISKDFVPEFDKLSTDARSAMINEALSVKAEVDRKSERVFLYTRLVKHVLVCIFTIVISVPFLFWLANKSIAVTAQNYGYVQKNFENLYKERIDRERNIQTLDVLRSR